MTDAPFLLLYSWEKASAPMQPIRLLQQQREKCISCIPPPIIIIIIRVFFFPTIINGEHSDTTDYILKQLIILSESK